MNKKKEVKAFSYSNLQVKARRGKDGRKSYYVKVKKDGKGTTLTGKTKDEIKRKIDDFKAGKTEKAEKKKKFKSAWNEFLTERRGQVQDNTWRNYCEQYESHLKYFSAMDMTAITKEAIGEYVSRELTGLKPTTQADNVRVLFAFLNWAYDKGFIKEKLKKKDVPELYVSASISSQTKPKINVMSVKEYEAYRERYLTASLSGDMALLCDGAFYAGLRISECVGLRGMDVTQTEAGPVIKVRQKAARGRDGHHIITIYSEILKSKNSRRTIPISEDLYEKLKQRQGERDGHDVLFDGIVFSALSSRYSAIARKAQKDGAKTVTFHELRKSFLTRCAAAGMDPYTLQKIAGHDSIETTLKCYIGLNEDDAAEKARETLNLKNQSKTGEK